MIFARPHMPTRQVIILVMFVLSGLIATFALQRRIDRLPAPRAIRIATEQLYVTPEAARTFVAPALRGLVADWYWLRVLQYVGGKFAAHGDGDVNINNLQPFDMKLLAPLLDHTTTLDPRFMAAYEYGAAVLPAVDGEAAVKLIEKGIRANPREWRLYHQLGYIYWQQNRFQLASETYNAGSKLPNAPSWMQVLAARMAARGGSREVAREMLMRLYTEADDEAVKAMALKRLLQLQAADEQSALHKITLDYRAQTSRCPSAWNQVSAATRQAQFKVDASGQPLDPTGVPYVLIKDLCGVEIDSRSEVPRK